MSAPGEVQATEQRLKDLIQEHALTPWAGAMLWVAAHAMAKAHRHAERDRLLSESGNSERAS
ncbi:MAG: hypothetical protein ACPGJF_05655 [Sinimarinibacterium flocculans]|uniref:hypothetical protein n=1 Tax=Sinimarinibacterium flocculans TaxID=985250 RepID=UPI003C3B7241